MIRTSTPTTSNLNSSNSTSSASTPARSNSVLPSVSTSTINSVPSIASTTSLSNHAAISRPSSTSSSNTSVVATAGLQSFALPPTGLPVIPGLGLGLPGLPPTGLPNHALMPTLAAQQQQAQLVAFQSNNNNAPKSSNGLNSSLNNQSLSGSKKKSSGGAFKLNLTPNKWSSMHLTIALEIRRTTDSQKYPSSTSHKSQQHQQHQQQPPQSSIDHKSNSNSNSKSRSDHSSSINQQQQQSKSLVPVSASNTSTLNHPHLPLHLAGLPGLNPHHHLALPNAAQFPFPGALPTNPDILKNMNSLFPGLNNMNTTTASSSIGLHQPAITTLTNSSALNRFPPFPGSLLNNPPATNASTINPLNPHLNSTPLKSDPLTQQQSTNSSSSPFTNATAAAAAAANSLFLRPQGFMPPFGLQPTMPGLSTPVSSIQHPSPVLPPTSSGFTPNLSNLTTDMWSRARMFSPLLNAPTVGVLPGWSPLKASDQQPKSLSTSNNSTGKSKESQSKSLKTASNSSLNNGSLHKPSSSSFNDSAGLLRNGNLSASSPLLTNNNSHSNSSLFNTPTGSYQRPPSRSIAQQQQQQPQQTSSSNRSHRRELEKQGYKREHSSSPANHHAQFNSSSSSLYHHANKLQKTASSALTPTNSMPSTVNSVIPGFPNPVNSTSLNPFDVPPHLLHFQNALPNAQLQTAAAAAANQLKLPPPPQSTASIAGLHSSSTMTSNSMKSKELETQSKLAQHQTPNGFPPANLLPPSSILSSGPSPAEQLALLHNDQMALERAKMFNMVRHCATYPGLANLPGSTNQLTTNPLLAQPNAFQSSANAAAMHSLHSADAMKYLNSASMYPGVSMYSGLNHPPSSLNPSGIPGLNSALPPGLMPQLPPDPFKLLTDFTTRSNINEQQQQQLLFSKYSILSSAGGGTSLSDIGKLSK